MVQGRKRAFVARIANLKIYVSRFNDSIYQQVACDKEHNL